MGRGRPAGCPNLKPRIHALFHVATKMCFIIGSSGARSARQARQRLERLGEDKIRQNAKYLFMFPGCAVLFTFPLF